METLKKLWHRLQAKPDRFDLLKEVLSSDEMRIDFLGYRKNKPVDPNRVVQDISRMIRYSATEDYQVWAREAWTHVLGSVDSLADPKTTNVDFCRGRLSMAITLLGIAHKARAMEESAKKQAEIAAKQ